LRAFELLMLREIGLCCPTLDMQTLTLASLLEDANSYCLMPDGGLREASLDGDRASLRGAINGGVWTLLDDEAALFTPRCRCVRM
jgi:hypothetical protein